MNLKKMLSGVLIFSLCFGITAPAFAVGPEDVPDIIKYEDTTYYNVRSDSFDKSSKKFIKELLEYQDGNVMPGQFHPGSAVTNWQYLAFRLQDLYGRGTESYKAKNRLDDILYYHGNYFKTGVFHPKSNFFGEAESKINKPGSLKCDVYGTGLEYAGSMDRALSDMEKQVYDWYYNAETTTKKRKKMTDAVASIDSIHQDTNPQDVFWIADGAFRTGGGGSGSGLGKNGHYQAYGVLFSNFSISTITPEDKKKNFETTVTSNPTDKNKTFASNVKNMTAVPINAKQGIENTLTNTATSEINGSKSYSFEEHISVGYEHKTLLGGKINAEVGFKAGQVIENGWAENKSCSNTSTSSYDVAVDLPAYTNIMLKQTDSTKTTETNYTCPVALNYKVTIVEYTLDPSDHYADPHSKILATFGGTPGKDYGNARKDLKRRALTESSITDSDRINWVDLTNRLPEVGQYIIPALTSTVPMSAAGAKMVLTEKQTQSEVDSLQPIYPLTSVRTAEDVSDYHMTVGDKLYLDNIELVGLNQYDAPYYGFNPKYGKWVITDKDGKEQKDSKTAKIKQNKTSKSTELICGEEPGTVYLKYKISEDRYNSVKHPKTFATNDTLENTATVKVVVSRKPFKSGHVAISGSLTGIAGDPFIAIEGKDGLSYELQDATGKEISRPVEWDAKELPRKGILVENNQIRFTRPGTYHIRATAGDVRSDWFQVTALPERKLTTILIPETGSLDARTSSSYYLPNIRVTYLDQYGKEWKDRPALSWTCDGKPLEVDNDVMRVPPVGSHALQASAEGIRSNAMNLTVIDTSAKAYSKDKDLLLTVNPVDAKIANKTSSMLRQDKKTDLVQGAHHYLDISAIRNGVMVQNFVNPILVDIPMTDSCMKKIKDPSKLTLAQILQNKKGEIRLDYVGGRYDAKNKLFRAKIDDTGNYVFVEKEDINKIVLRIGDRNTLYNDKPKRLDVAPMIINGRTMVPLRYIGEAIGCEVKWNGDERSTITIHKKTRNMKITIDQEIPEVGVAPVIVNNRTLAPIRYISEFLGANVIYDPALQEIIINP